MEMFPKGNWELDAVDNVASWAANLAHLPSNNTVDPVRQALANLGFRLSALRAPVDFDADGWEDEGASVYPPTLPSSSQPMASQGPPIVVKPEDRKSRPTPRTKATHTEVTENAISGVDCVENDIKVCNAIDRLLFIH
jgi:hypothetical protein